MACVPQAQRQRYKQAAVGHNSLETFGKQTAGHVNLELLDALNVQLLPIYKLYDLHVRESERGMHRRSVRNKSFR